MGHMNVKPTYSKKDGKWYMLGYEVKDADYPLKLNVKAWHIKHGTPHESTCCALAKCARDMYSAEEVVISRWYGYVAMPLSSQSDEIVLWRYRITGKSKYFTEEYDLGKLVETGFYELPPPNPSERLGSPSKKARAQRAKDRREEEDRLIALGLLPPRKPKKPRRKKNGSLNDVLRHLPKEGSAKPGRKPKRAASRKKVRPPKAK